jgi:hypothetical protein
MSADQISIVLIVLIVVLVANLAMMGAVVFVGIRRRGAAAKAPIDDGSADAFGDLAEDAAVSRRVAAIADSVEPELDDASMGSAAAAAASRGHVAAQAGADAARTRCRRSIPGLLTDDDGPRSRTGSPPDSRIAWERTPRRRGDPPGLLPPPAILSSWPARRPRASGGPSRARGRRADRHRVAGPSARTPVRAIGWPSSRAAWGPPMETTRSRRSTGARPQRLRPVARRERRPVPIHLAGRVLPR